MGSWAQHLKSAQGFFPRRLPHRQVCQLLARGGSHPGGGQRHLEADFQTPSFGSSNRPNCASRPLHNHLRSQARREPCRDSPLWLLRNQQAPLCSLQGLCTPVGR